MTETKKQNKKILVGVVALIAVIAVLTGVWFAFGPKAVQGAKSITIEVIDNEEKLTEYKVNTDVEYLRQAMEEAEGLEFSGTESEYGLMLGSVNGLYADYSVDGAYWSVLVNGTYGMYGIDSQPVMDGDVYTILYTVDFSE